MADERTWDQHREEAENWVKEIENECENELDAKELDKSLMNAAYTFSELGLWRMDDVAIKDREILVRIWAVVEAVKRGGFPAELRM